ncbi:P-loop containing nucleoside triphosphate hydrolase protein [Phanerochaete sordida]|uniref:P-loop containing nucleoside triphosphate hydrolase protein n=1 Tax=Phanerochaete sordida TaxID=48140 RepID=A0A9P3L8L1_9APHY|nr:P-loop containing nucleoside triphosphate hydrolase protein [Phanerochaete sordida]
MDVEFDTLAEENVPAVDASLISPAAALAYFDEAWYLKASRRARRMDLIGDYAGSELFIIDGDSLVELALDDPLLALARQNEISFQILHAVHNVEKLLNDFLKRGAVFEIVFWDDARHLTARFDADNFIFASRSLARTMLIEQSKHLNIPVHTFASLEDKTWLKWQSLHKPMYIMINDGGAIDLEHDAEASHATSSKLLQRTRIFHFITRGLTCSMLRGTAFRDSKILSFIYEQHLDPNARQRLSPHFWKAVDAARQSLDQLEAKRRETTSSTSPAANDSQSLEGFLTLAETIFGLTDPRTSLALYAFTAHLILLPLLSVEQRSQPYKNIHPGLEEFLRNNFLPTALLVYAATLGRSASADVDGRIFRDLLHFLLAEPSLTSADVLGEKVAEELDGLWIKRKLPKVNSKAVSAQYPVAAQETSGTSTDAETPPLQLLPFYNEVFNESLAEANISVPETHEDIEVAEMDFNTVFKDAQHWHNHRRAVLPKHLGGEDKLPALDERQRKKQLRSEQRFTAKLQWQAESLTGAFGKALQRITIIPGAKPQLSLPSTRATTPASTRPSTPLSSTFSDSGSDKPRKGGKEKKVHLSKAEQIRQQNMARKVGSQDLSNETWWKDQLEKMDGQSTEEKIALMDRLLGNATRAESGWLAVELRMFRIHLEFQRWLEDPDADADDEAKQARLRDIRSVAIMRMVKDLAERGGLFPAARTALENVLQCLGFAEYIPVILDVSPNPVPDDRKLAFKFKKLVHSKNKAPMYEFMQIKEDPVVWQLRLFGEYMDRSMDSQPDSRVSFHPDAWQRRVLDCLDDVDEDQHLNHSVLVVAPTSAGKTFVSYYAMEQVLRRSDDEILVYVAPTKALVSQIAAEVYARFNKSYKAVGKSLWAIHTRDYRIHNPQNCQILVTVPEMLAIMLLSPQLARVWTPKIKRIILDEIHSIGQQEGGAVWEQIILLAPCPIVGLSATIGEAEKFNDWLASVQKAHGFKHTFIHHPHRYSHLRKFDYVLQAAPKRRFTGADTYLSTERMRFLHPVSLLSFGARALPSDFSLESADCLSLFRAFVAVEGRDAANLQALDPSKFFKRGLLLKQKDVLEYEVALKERLASLIAGVDAQEETSTLNQVVRKLQDPMLAELSEVDRNTAASVQDIFDNLLYLVCDLNASGDLPAILFNFDRTACEIATKRLLESLENAEAKWRQSSPEWKRKIQQWEKWKSQAAMREKLADRQKKQKKDAADDAPSNNADPSWEATFDPDEPSPQFSFLGKKVSKTILHEAIEDIKWTTTPKWALDALSRGIGIHHAGMNKHYRTAVESLYRMGYIQVVIATGTLALGINAPTRTSVFVGDSPFLTALMYRQCAGRAGRRGFDLLGKVVFYGLPADRVQRLVLSRLPSIGGNFPLTSTMVLRLFNLLQGSGYAPAAVNAIKSLLELPHVSFVFETGKQELLHHVRFSIDYLRRSRLLDAQGNPINLFGLAAHLYYTEPSNFALVTLMRRGVVHEICNQTSTESAKRDFLLLLCHLFGRRFLPPVYASEHHARTVHRKSASKVVLPQMPVAAQQLLAEHDKDILRIFTSYAAVFANRLQNAVDADKCLPLSGREFEGVDLKSAFGEHLSRSSVKVVARSPFVANSGHDDTFRSVPELAQTSRAGLHLNEHGIPSMQQFTASPQAGEALPLNAYLLDFYTHGQPATLVAANGIRQGELWYLLEDFTLTLKTIRSTIEHLLLKSESSPDVDLDDEMNIGGVNLAEAEADEDGSSGTTIKRPPGVSDRDWRVFEIADLVTKEFDEKFRAMWA